MYCVMLASSLTISEDSVFFYSCIHANRVTWKPASRPEKASGRLSMSLWSRWLLQFQSDRVLDHTLIIRNYSKLCHWYCQTASSVRSVWPFYQQWQWLIVPGILVGTRDPTNSPREQAQQKFLQIFLGNFLGNFLVCSAKHRHKQRGNR